MGGELKSLFSTQMKPEEQRYYLTFFLNTYFYHKSMTKSSKKIKLGKWLQIIYPSSDHRYMRENSYFKI